MQSDDLRLRFAPEVVQRVTDKVGEQVLRWVG